MANGPSGIDGYGNGYVNWYSNFKNKPNNSEESTENNVAYNAQEHEDTQVDPNKVMDFLARNNYFIPVSVESVSTTEVNDVDAATEERIAGYMERFEEIYSIIEQEFGTEMAPSVMDLVMDKLMGMA